MTFIQFYFSMNGRITAAEFWLKGFFPLLSLFFVLPMSITVVSHYFTGKQLEQGSFQTLMILWIVLLTYIEIAVATKRWHDFNKSGWWNLVALIPVIGLWVLLKCGTAYSTKGNNKYGPDPFANNFNLWPESTLWKATIWFLYLFGIGFIALLIYNNL